ncbi:MAG: tetratricopeptide repeat protein, partial [Bacteroidia bacterium]
MNFTTEFDNLIEEAEKFEDGQKEKSRILERAIKLAQEHKDREREFDAKLDYIKSTVYASEIDKALATFPWLLNYIDEQEKNKGEDGVSFHFFYGSPKDHVLWMYKWVLSDLPYYPNISKEKIDAALADMARRYQQEGHGDLTVKEYELILAREMGHRAKANEIWAYLKANKDKSSDMSDCPTCLRHDEVETYIFLKEYDQAIEHARPILEGEIRCSSKPYSTYGLMFPVFIHLGQFDKARHYYQKYLEESKKPENEENPKSNLLLFYALTGQFDKGIVYLETYLEQVLSTIEQDDPFK